MCRSESSAPPWEEGVVVRYDEAVREVVGLTVIGLRERVLKGLVGDEGR